MKKTKLRSTFILLLALTTAAMAWDGRRKGFVLGLGAGYGNLWLTREVENFDIRYSRGYPIIVNYKKETRTDDESSLMSDFKLGFAPSNKLAIYWMNKVAWLDLNDGEYAISSGVAGLGFSYYDKPQAPCMYYTGGIGYSTWSMPFSSNPEAAIGIGLSLGAGYEFAKHWSIEGNVTYGNPKKKEWGWDASVLAVRVTVNVLGY